MTLRRSVRKMDGLLPLTKLVDGLNDAARGMMVYRRVTPEGSGFRGNLCRQGLKRICGNLCRQGHDGL